MWNVFHHRNVVGIDDLEREESAGGAYLYCVWVESSRQPVAMEEFSRLRLPHTLKHIEFRCMTEPMAWRTLAASSGASAIRIMLLDDDGQTRYTGK